MRQELRDGNRSIFSRALAQGLKDCIAGGHQAILFLNRRGASSIVQCRDCGHVVTCRSCSVSLTYHFTQSNLLCHRCNRKTRMPTTCPDCKRTHIRQLGAGTQRVVEEVKKLLPGTTVDRLDADATRSGQDTEDTMARLTSGDTQVLVGTQMVAKGHNFPLLTLVGVIDADLGLQGSDLRAAERTFQLMRQVAGRAGRVEKKGLALLQTYQPEHPVIRAILSGDEEAFWQAEAREREAAGVPPYGRMAGIILSSENAAEVFGFASELARHDGPLRQVSAQVFGPAPAPIARTRGRHRVRLLVKAAKGVPLQGALKTWVAQFRVPNSVRLAIDIDPQSFL